MTDKNDTPTPARLAALMLALEEALANLEAHMSACEANPKKQVTRAETLAPAEAFAAAYGALASAITAFVAQRVEPAPLGEDTIAASQALAAFFAAQARGAAVAERARRLGLAASQPTRKGSR